MISSPLFRLLALPTAAWNMVKGNESFNFMAFVKSNNYMNAKIENSGAIVIRVRHAWAPQSGILGNHPGNI